MKKKAYISPVIKLHLLRFHVMLNPGSLSQGISGLSIHVDNSGSPQEEEENPNDSRSWRDWDDWDDDY